MTFLALLPGIALPALVGWLILELLQWRTRVLWRAEQWVLGFALGLTFSMFCMFLGNIVLGIPLTPWGFTLIFGVLIVILVGARWWMMKGRMLSRTEAPVKTKTSRRWTIALSVLGGWVALRVMLLAADILATPTFFDDSMDNWNLRAKVFLAQKNFSIAFPWDPNPGVGSYPPAVSLAKTWLTTLAGGWSEALANIVHPLWFACLLLILYWMLRRSMSRNWAALGSLILASLPLELIQGMNAYADVFLSLHLFIAVMLMYRGLVDRERWSVWFRMAAFAIALLPFTKNEGWGLYFPTAGLLFCASLGWMYWKRRISAAAMMNTAAWLALIVLCVVGPWIGFKLLNGLNFGNAKGVDLNLAWQHGVVLSIIVNMFFEGNWGLLFPLFFGLLIVRFRAAFASPIVVLTVAFLIPYCGQLFLYLFTGLSTEALLQTGYARGIVHLMPIVVSATTLLLHNWISREE